MPHENGLTICRLMDAEHHRRPETSVKTQAHQKALTDVSLSAQTVLKRPMTPTAKAEVRRLTALPDQKTKRREKQRLPDLDILLAQRRQSKTFRLPVEICELLEKAKLWQRLDGKKPDNEQDIVAEALLEWLSKRRYPR